MKSEFQDANWIIPKTQRFFTKNPHRSISATFRYFRNHPRSSHVGCFPILATIIDTVHSMNITISRKQILYAFNKSEELCELPHGDKTILIDQLATPMSVETRQGIIADKTQPKKKDRQSYVIS